MRSIFLAFAVWTALLVIAEDASACSCVTRITMREKYSFASYVVVGRVTSIRQVKSRLNAPGWGGFNASYEIGEMVKGQRPGVTTVTTGYGSGDCGVPLMVGVSYIFFIGPTAEVDICSGTQPFVPGQEQSEKYLKEVRSYAPRKNAL